MNQRKTAATILAAMAAMAISFTPVSATETNRPVAGKPLHFALAGKEGVHYQPYWQIQSETFTCFPTMR